jgi:uncharacterized damage-inducible protein DinB
MSQKTLIELLYGKGAHASPLACIEDLPAELAIARPEKLPHTIWQLVGHINYWMAYDIRRMQGETQRYPAHASESWPENPATIAESEWKNELSRFSALLATLAEMAGWDAKKLAGQASPAPAQEGKQNAPILDVLWQTAIHNSYHVGQIAMLRRFLGAWPPRAGGDSW